MLRYLARTSGAVWDDDISLLLSFSPSTGNISVVKEIVDKLLKGYDVRLRPDFGGMVRAGRGQGDRDGQRGRDGSSRAGVAQAEQGWPQWDRDGQWGRDGPSRAEPSSRAGMGRDGLQGRDGWQGRDGPSGAGPASRAEMAPAGQGWPVGQNRDDQQARHG